MSRIWDALTVAQDEVTQRLASLSEPSPPEEPTLGSSGGEDQSPLPPEAIGSGADELFPQRDHFAPRRQLASTEFAVEGMTAAESDHAPPFGKARSDDQKLDSLFQTQLLPGAGADAQPQATSVGRSQHTGIRQAALIAALLLTIAAVVGIQFWRVRSAQSGVAPPPGWAVEQKPVPPAEVRMVVVGPNQTLAGISMLYLGEYNPAVLAKLRTLNPGLRDPDHIVVGQQIRLPVVAAGESPDTSSRTGGKPEEAK